MFKRAITEIVELLTEVGVDVVTDGEVRRENYIHYFCRRLKGFDFNNCTYALKLFERWNLLEFFYLE